MPLVKATLKTQLSQAFDSALKIFMDQMQAAGSSQTSVNAARAAAALKFGTDVSNAVDAYIKSATIIVPPGQVVATAGTPAAQTGSTTTPSSPATIS